MDEKETVLGSQGTIILEENVYEYIRYTNKEAERKIRMKKREKKVPNLTLKCFILQLLYR